MADTIQRRVRGLRDWEIEQARPAFGDTLNYDKVRVCEGYGWPDYANRFGRFIRRQWPAPRPCIIPARTRCAA